MFMKLHRYGGKKLNGLGFREFFCFTFACQPENPFLLDLLLAQFDNLHGISDILTKHVILISSFD